MDFHEQYDSIKHLVEEYLFDFLKRKDDGTKIFEAIKYSCEGAGKRMRPVLAYATVEMLGGKAIDALPFAIAIELIHTYSLIHDDMPCMDDDDERRGKPTVHKKFGENIALLAGDSLQSLAFEAALESQINPYIVIECMQTISTAATKMVHGQELDLSTRKKTVEELVKLNSLKTGALISASVWVGGLVGGAPIDKYEDLGTFAKNIGLAFQLKDDMLDNDGFLEVITMEQAKKMLEELNEEAKFAIHEEKEKSFFLQDFANWLIEREK